MLNVVNIIGVDDSNTVIIKKNGGTMSRMELTVTGNNTLLEQSSLPDVKLYYLIFGGEHMQISLQYPDDALWFNSISSADGNKKSLSQLSDLLSSHPNKRIINPPEGILRTGRDRYAQYLSGIEGVCVPKCLRFTPEKIADIGDFALQKQMPYPFLFRPAADQGKASITKIDSENELFKLERYAFDGRSYDMVEYIDYRSPDGLYRKQRYLIIGDRVIPRHLMRSASWQIHSDNSTVSQEEIDFLQSADPSIVKRSLAIKEAFGLDYIGIDCAINQDGEMIIFETNSFSMIGEGKNGKEHQPVLEGINEAILKLLGNNTL